MRIAPEQLDRIVEHARREHPNECCGFVSLRDGVAVGVHEMENVAASRMRFEIDGKAILALLDEVEGRGEDLGVIYHSHTRSEPYPSQTDVNFAANWPGVEWLIVGLGDPAGAPVVRSFRIDDGEIAEVEVAVDGSP